MDKSNLRIVILFFLMLCIALFIYTDRQQDFYSEQAEPAAEAMIRALSDWEKTTLLQHLSLEAKQTLSDEQLDKLLQHYRQFGQLQSLQPLQFSRMASALSLFGSQRIHYEADAIYSNGAAHINLTIIPYGTAYKIYNFSISKK